MADKDDASTDIVEKVKSFIKDFNKAWEDERKARQTEIDKLAKAAKAKKDDKAGKDEKPAKGGGAKKEELAPLPEAALGFDPNPATECRTPAEQAGLITENKTWVCWSAHMADKARHVILKIDGKIKWDAKRELGADFDTFKKTWEALMKKHSLKNFKGGDGWGAGDEFHLELAESKMKRTDARVEACLDEYARLTRKDGKGKNDKFEKDYAKDLKSYFEKYEKKEEAPKRRDGDNPELPDRSERPRAGSKAGM